MLFELCALKPAFDAQNLISLFYKITNAQYRTLPEHFSAELKNFVTTILVKEPDQRPRFDHIFHSEYIIAHNIAPSQAVVHVPSGVLI